MIYQGSLLGTYKGPGTNGQVLDIVSKEGVTGTHVVIQMESRFLNLAEIEVFGEPATDTGVCNM